MEVREARWNEIQRIAGITGLTVEELREARTWVAVDSSGSIIAAFPLRLMWFGEPLVVQGKNRMESSRAAVLVYKAAEDFIASCQTPQLPPRGLFVSTRSKA